MTISDVEELKRFLLLYLETSTKDQPEYNYVIYKTIIDLAQEIARLEEEVTALKLSLEKMDDLKRQVRKLRIEQYGL